ncbi:hypothetical protein JR316_0004578 [Psilocybe cubensis]|uniref:Uncharacterized protein n=2 Tax=Psilocybe cubensis TaxID=181762 RepID=A0ACB8H3B9_PSICU|nr:hypothetical protein JR316_0004578 [Psilocybe cubensis]KAH9482478.1 hypothetical protein JR316_0004578 [Psilocybe cubensis]
MPIDTPAALVDEFKKTGEFERLRRELLAQFQQDESYPSFKEGIERIARKRMTNDQGMHFQTVAGALHELNQEVQRYPIIERAVANVQPNAPILESMQQTLQKILNDEKNPGSAQSAPKVAQNGTTTSTEAALTAETKPENTAQDQVDGETKAADTAPMVTAVSEPLNSEAPAETPTNAADNLDVTTQNTSSSKETNDPPIALPEPNVMNSETSSGVVSAEKSNVSMVVDDQPESTTKDIEMEDVQPS